MIAAAAKSGGDLNIAAMTHHQVRTALTAAAPKTPRLHYTNETCGLSAAGWILSQQGGFRSVSGSWLHH